VCCMYVSAKGFPSEAYSCAFRDEERRRGRLSFAPITTGELRPSGRRLAASRWRDFPTFRLRFRRSLCLSAFAAFRLSLCLSAFAAFRLSLCLSAFALPFGFRFAFRLSLCLSAFALPFGFHIFQIVRTSGLPGFRASGLVLNFRLNGPPHYRRSRAARQAEVLPAARIGERPRSPDQGRATGETESWEGVL
jgi:hypothetical protein